MSTNKLTHTRWTKRAAIARMEQQPLLVEALRIEPRLQRFVDEAKTQQNVDGYNRIRTYIRLRNACSSLVGWFAENASLKTREHYSAVTQTIADLLPPDDVDPS